jgi:NADPH:quinone reductase-like Zn-dependent oxidoreductase
MKAIAAGQYGPPEVLKLIEVEKPVPKDHEILVKVRATTVNVGDCRMRGFTVPPMFWLPGRIALGFRKPRQPIFGMELAGDVEAVGSKVTRFKVGDPVIASTFKDNYGAHAEYKCLPDDGTVMPKPKDMTYEEAAALTIGANTALHFLRQGRIQAGHKVLIIGASGSVGTYAVQLAKSFGAEVTGVCSSDNIELVQSLGADKVIDYKREDFTKNGVIYDIIFDAAGKTNLPQCAGSLKSRGAYLHTGMVGSEHKVLWYSLTTDQQVVGGTAVPNQANLAYLLELAAAGRLRAVIDRCYPLEQTAQAHRYVEQGRKRGNVVITL